MKSVMYSLIFFCCFEMHTQPGWQDFTARYFYTILDDNGKEIVFKDNISYNVMVNDIHYESSKIPKDSLKAASPLDEGYQNQIRINDFSLTIPQKHYKQNEKRLEIKIIHKKDTMFINQSSGTGSRYWNRLGFNEKSSKHNSDYTVQFVPGRYYFPQWTQSLLDNLPETSGNVKIKNINQSHYLVPKIIYDSIGLGFSNYNIKLAEKASDYVVNNYINGHLKLEKRSEPIKFENPPKNFSEPTWFEPIYPSKNKNIYLGKVTYRRDSLNSYSSKTIFSIYNKSENTIKHWFPTNPNLFYCDQLYFDTFNDKIFQTVWICEKLQDPSNQREHIPSKRHVYQSEDEGKSWAENKSLTKLFHQYDFRHITFLDKNYVITFNSKDVKHKNEKYKIKQTTYYLLKNWKPIDSLKTSNEAYHYHNYIDRNHLFSVKDTLLLGTWNKNKNENISNINSYFQAIATKTNSGWKLKSGQNLYKKPIRFYEKQEKDTINYKNFKLLNQRELLFNNGSGSLKLNRDVVEDFGRERYYIIENGPHIYLFQTDNYGNDNVLISFDGGTSWFVYPQALGERNRFKLFEIDEEGIISYFNQSMHKVFHKFSETD